MLLIQLVCVSEVHAYKAWTSVWVVIWPGLSSTTISPKLGKGQVNPAAIDSSVLNRD